jgi:hypothetical protein
LNVARRTTDIIDMDDLLGGLAEIIFYLTGRLLLPLLSLGRIKVEPLTQPVGRARVMPAKSTGEIVVGEGWAMFAGLLIWVATIALGVFLHYLRLF